MNRGDLPVFRAQGTVLEVKDEHHAVLEQTQQLLGHRFTQPELLLEALLHPSMREQEHASYERLEFLGDSVLGLIVADLLFHRFPDSAEGELTRIKSMVVSRAALAGLGRRLRLGEVLLLGKGMQGQELSRAVIANATEALIGALYEDGGFEAARRFVLEHLGPRVERSVARRDSVNHKSLLQEFTQQLGHGTPTYEVLAVHGPDHERSFDVRAVLERRTFPTARGNSKKAAEQRAARIALRILESESDGKEPTPSP